MDYCMYCDYYNPRTSSCNLSGDIVNITGSCSSYSASLIDFRPKVCRRCDDCRRNINGTFACYHASQFGDTFPVPMYQCLYPNDNDDEVEDDCNNDDEPKSSTSSVLNYEDHEKTLEPLSKKWASILSKCLMVIVGIFALSVLVARIAGKNSRIWEYVVSILKAGYDFQSIFLDTYGILFPMVYCVLSFLSGLLTGASEKSTNMSNSETSQVIWLIEGFCTECIIRFAFLNNTSKYSVYPPYPWAPTDLFESVLIMIVMIFVALFIFWLGASITFGINKLRPVNRNSARTGDG